MRTSFVACLILSLVPSFTGGQTVTSQDCAGAIAVCQNNYFQPNSFVGTGVVPNEINGATSCLKMGERNDVWYTFTIQTGGQLCFSITPNNLMPGSPPSGDDYDWALYDLTNASCAAIASQPQLEVSCNYSGVSAVTGANGLPGATNQPCVAVNAGETYVLNVSNFSSTQFGYALAFTGSAVLFSQATASYTLTKTDFCPGETVVADGTPSLGEANHFWSVQQADAAGNGFGPEVTSWFTGQAGPFNVSAFANSQGLPLQCDSYYRVKVAVSSACTPWSEFTRLIHILPCVEADAGPDHGICPGECVKIGTKGEPWWTTHYQWSPSNGLTNPQKSRTRACPTMTTTYTLTVTDKSTGCQGSDQTTVSVGALADAGPDLQLSDPISCGVNPGNSAPLGAPGQPGCQYQWSPSTYLDDPTKPQPTVTHPGGPFETQTYTLTVVCEGQRVCTRSDQVQVSGAQC